MKPITFRSADGSKKTIRDSFIKTLYRRIVRFLITGSIACLAVAVHSQTFNKPGVISVSGSTVTVSAPGGGSLATEATLSTLNGKVTTVNTDAVTISAALPTGTNNVGTVNGSTVAVVGLNGAAIVVNGSGVTQPISAASLPLPSGAATEATLSTLNGKVTAVNTGAIVFNGAQPINGSVSVIGTTGTFASPYYVISTNTVVSTGSVTAFQGGAPWAVNGSVSVMGTTGTFTNPYYFISTNTVISTGSITAFLATGTNIIGRVNGSTIAVQCLNAAGTAFESCAGGGSSGGVTSVFVTSGTVALSSGSFNTPFHVISTNTVISTGTITAYIANSTVSIQGSNGSNITATGNSLNVNCTGGCSSPTQAVSFIAVATATLVTGATHFTLMNHAGSTGTLKIQRVDISMYSDAAVTGVVTGFKMYKITAATAPTTAMLNSRIFKMDESNGYVASGVTLSTGGSGTNPTFAMPSIALGAASMTSEETTLVDPAVLYEFRNLGDAPLRLGPGNGIIIKQAGLPAATAGKIIIRAFFTQE